jgi:MHS family shikimate/dehydroshikimate transporter-like MFS transporter
MSASLSIVRRSAFASLIGTCIELYDFYIYATAAAIVFNKLFFPTYDPLVGTLLSFATFAIGAIMRPLGGMVCGHFGDRIGRKSMLVFTLVTMGVSTFAIGLLPTYGQVGILAPIMLVVLRMVQGFAFGGEWGGAVLMSVEHAPAARRGFYGSFTQMGSPIALFLSTGTFSALSFLPQESFLTGAGESRFSRVQFWSSSAWSCGSAWSSHWNSPHWQRTTSLRNNQSPRFFATTGVRS